MNEAGQLAQTNIRDNLQMVLERIERAARRSGRDPQSVKLVIVTKKQPVELIRCVIQAGGKFLGENYADEAVPKIDSLSGIPGIKWHMVGHVQSRKADLVCQYFDYVHSLDSLKLAERYNRYAEHYGQRLPVLLQFNVSGEGSKSGWEAWQETQLEGIRSDINKILELPNLEVQGLMTMPPYTDNPEDARPFFRRLVRLRDYLSGQFPHTSWEEISMGMSGDYEVAVEEGATWVRIGQAILGLRPS